MERADDTNEQDLWTGRGAAVPLDEPLLDCQAAAALLNVRVSWVRDAARQGHLPSLRVGRHLRFTRAMLEGWLAEQVAGRAGATRAYPRPANGRGGRSGRAAYQAQYPGGAVGEPGGEPNEQRGGARWVAILAGS